MKQTSSITRQMAEAQERHAARNRASAPQQTYRIYVGVPDAAGIAATLALAGINATVYSARGVWFGSVESSTIVERINADLAEVLALARTLRTRYAESSVLVTANDTRVWSVED